MNNDLISRSALKEEFEKLCKTHCELKKKDLCSITCPVLAFKETLANAPTVSERPQGESISLEDGLKKARRGKYVIYDVDFLLDNLAREVNIMESARQMKAGRGNDNE